MAVAVRAVRPADLFGMVGWRWQLRYLIGFVGWSSRYGAVGPLGLVGLVGRMFLGPIQISRPHRFVCAGSSSCLVDSVGLVCSAWFGQL